MMGTATVTWTWAVAGSWITAGFRWLHAPNNKSALATTARSTSRFRDKPLNLRKSDILHKGTKKGNGRGPFPLDFNPLSALTRFPPGGGPGRRAGRRLHS